MSSSDPRERRMFPRFKLDSMVKIKMGGHIVVGELKTIGVGGVSFDLNFPIYHGRDVNLIITGPNGKEHIDVYGRIVWNLDHKSYGVQFFPLGEVITSRILQWSESLAQT